MKLFLMVFFTACCSLADAGVLVLSNDDRINGLLVRLDGEHVVWKTANFGEQWVKRTNIKSIATDQQLKINGSAQACHIAGLDGDQLTYSCGDSQQLLRIPFLTLKVMIPFEDYKKGALTQHGKINLWGAY